MLVVGTSRPDLQAPGGRRCQHVAGLADVQRLWGRMPGRDAAQAGRARRRGAWRASGGPLALPALSGLLRGSLASARNPQQKWAAQQGQQAPFWLAACASVYSSSGDLAC